MNTQEQIFTYPLYPDSTMFSHRGLVKPDAYQRMMSSIQYRHRVNMHQDIPTMIQTRGISWVMLSMTVEVFDPVKNGEELIAKTWSSGREGFIFRKETAFYRPDGTMAFAGATFYGIMELATRKLCKDPAILDLYTAVTGDQLLQACSRHPIDPAGLRSISTASIRPSWLDIVGHMNNTRYGELVFDALETAGFKQNKPYRRIEFDFTGELCSGDHVEILAHAQDNVLSVCGVRIRDQKQSFAIHLHF